MGAYDHIKDPARRAKMEALEAEELAAQAKAVKAEPRKKFPDFIYVELNKAGLVEVYNQFGQRRQGEIIERISPTVARVRIVDDLDVLAHDESAGWYGI